MKYANSLNLMCSHCKNNCQFLESGGLSHCHSDNTHHFSYLCTHCGGRIMVRFNQSPYNSNQTPYELIDYYPVPSLWKSRIKLNLITDENVKNDFIEAISCFNYGFYNASMVIARRAIHQEMIKRGLEKQYPNNLYKQLENSGISDKLKELLQKVKNFGNNGAHPDFCLYDENGNKLTDIQKFAELSLNFLDKYFSDEYETDSMIASAPLSEQEISKNNQTN